MTSVLVEFDTGMDVIHHFADRSAVGAAAPASPKAVAEDIRAIFNAPDAHEAKRLLERFVNTWEPKAPKLTAWAADALPEGFTVFALPVAHRRRLRTSNAIERLNKELLRRTRVATLFPSDTSCERLVTAVAMEISDDWLTGRAYLNMHPTD